MKLIYSIPDKLYYIQDFLDYPTYKKLHHDVFKKKLINKFKKNKNSTTHLFSIAEYEPVQKIKILLENNKFYKTKITNYKPLIYSMGDGYSLNWHNDHGYTYGITYYINRRWNPLFGGEFLFRDKNVNGSIPVVGNSIVIIKIPLDHKVTPVMKPIVSRKTIQIFVKN